MYLFIKQRDCESHVVHCKYFFWGLLWRLCFLHCVASMSKQPGPPLLMRCPVSSHPLEGELVWDDGHGVLGKFQWLSDEKSRVKSKRLHKHQVWSNLQSVFQLASSYKKPYIFPPNKVYVKWIGCFLVCQSKHRSVERRGRRSSAWFPVTWDQREVINEHLGWLTSNEIQVLIATNASIGTWQTWSLTSWPLYPLVLLLPTTFFTLPGQWISAGGDQPQLIPAFTKQCVAFVSERSTLTSMMNAHRGRWNHSAPVHTPVIPGTF